VTDKVYLQRARDLAITDVRCEMRVAGLLTSRSGRTYLLYERAPPVRKRRESVDAGTVAAPVRRLIEAVLCVLCAGGALTAFWLIFFVFAP
jgi:hypothetical protein